MGINLTEIVLALIAIVGPVVSTIVERKRSKEELEKYKLDIKQQDISNDSDQVKLTEDAMHTYELIMNKALEQQNKLHKDEMDSMEKRLTEKINSLEDLVCLRLDCVKRINDDNCPMTKERGE